MSCPKTVRNDKILELYYLGIRPRLIAKEFGISKWRVLFIVKREKSKFWDKIENNPFK